MSVATADNGIFILHLRSYLPREFPTALNPTIRIIPKALNLFTWKGRDVTPLLRFFLSIRNLFILWRWRHVKKNGAWNFTYVFSFRLPVTWTWRTIKVNVKFAKGFNKKNHRYNIYLPTCVRRYETCVLSKLIELVTLSMLLLLLNKWIIMYIVHRKNDFEDLTDSYHNLFLGILSLYKCWG